MIELAAFAGSFLAIFVLASATRNKRHGRPNSRKLENAGYFLCGLLFATAAILLLIAVTGMQIDL